MKKKKGGEKQTGRIDIDQFNKKIDSFDKKMNQVRRDFILKSTKSKKSASDLVLNS